MTPSISIVIISLVWFIVLAFLNIITARDNTVSFKAGMMLCGCAVRSGIGTILAVLGFKLLPVAIIVYNFHKLVTTEP